MGGVEANRAADAANLDDSYETWQRHAERTEPELSPPGLLMRRVAIDLDALVAWSRGARQGCQRGLPR